MFSGLTRGQGITLALVFLAGVSLVGITALLLSSSIAGAPAPTPIALAASQTPATRPEPAAVTPGVDTPTPLAKAPSPSPAVFSPQACLAKAQAAEEGRAMAVLAEGMLRVDAGGKTFEVRLIGLDPAGSGGQALALLRELAEGQAVRLLRDGPDRDENGKARRYVLARQVFVNYEMVRRGAALTALYPPGMQCSETLLAAERMARGDGLGYWALQPDLPVSPLPAATASAQPCHCAQTYQCADFQTRAAAQACYNACGDYRNTTLDPDHNGLACEEMK